MTRGGQKQRPDAPERRCIATGQTGPKSGLIRFVVSPDGVVVPDLAEKLPGRGIWVSATAKALDKAAKKGLFARAAKQAVTVPPDLTALVEALLVKRLQDTIALARKAGRAVCGKEKVKALIEFEKAGLLVQAKDGSEREKSGLRPPRGPKSRLELLSANELGLAFGRDNVIHAAIAVGRFSDRVAYEAGRLAGFRVVIDPQRGSAAKAGGKRPPRKRG